MPVICFILLVCHDKMIDMYNILAHSPIFIPTAVTSAAGSGCLQVLAGICNLVLSNLPLFYRARADAFNNNANYLATGCYYPCAKYHEGEVLFPRS